MNDPLFLQKIFQAPNQRESPLNSNEIKAYCLATILFLEKQKEFSYSEFKEYSRLKTYHTPLY